MTAQGETYSHGRHIAKVQSEARRAGVKGATFAVLAYLCASSDYKRPEVLRSKANICERTGYSLDSVKAALASLRALGFIVPIAYETGGRNRATVYRVTTGQKGAENSTPISDKGGEFFPEKGGNFSPKRGGENPPPSVSSSVYPFRREKGAASSGGRAGGSLYAGASPGPRPGSPEAEALVRFNREVRLHGYGEAKRLADERKRAGQAGELP